MKIQLSDHFTVGRLLRFVFPSILMMIFTSIYGVVDGLFVSNFVGKTSFAAVNLIMPVLMGLGALGFMIGTGGSALVAVTLGWGKRERANALFSMLIYVVFKETFKHADVTAKQAANAGVKVQELSPAQTKSRIIALLLVFAVVIFFWMAFHQNGLTLTFFARDYTEQSVTGLGSMAFDVINLVLIIVVVYGLFGIFQSESGKGKITASTITVLALLCLGWKGYLAADKTIPILPQMFQQFNPFFVVALTPVSMAVFGALANKGKEPSAPRKIGIGMFIAAIGFCIMAVCSLGLPTPDEVKAGADYTRVSSNVLISTYLVLTFAELFLSPMGISFVSKVAPPKYKGMMMGCWFAATAIGNYLVSVIGMLWGGIPLWILWSILIALCLVSALFIFSIMKKLESATE